MGYGSKQNIIEVMFLSHDKKKMRLLDWRKETSKKVAGNKLSPYLEQKQPEFLIVCFVYHLPRG